jgi:hypothetical protein
LNQLKQESKKPTNKEVKRYIEHILWLKNWIKNIQDISHIPVSKHLQFTLEARALTITQMKELKPNKRYALTVILIHSQLNRTLDDIVEILIKKLRNYKVLRGFKIILY